MIERESLRPSVIDDSEPVPARSLRQMAAEAALLAPHTAVLLSRLVRDPRVPIRRKVVVAAAMAYVASPVDLIPSFVIGFGWLDDMLIVSLAIDHLMSGAEGALVIEHWPGTQDGLDLVRSAFSWIADLMPSGIRQALPR